MPGSLYDEAGRPPIAGCLNPANADEAEDGGSAGGAGEHEAPPIAPTLVCLPTQKIASVSEILKPIAVDDRAMGPLDHLSSVQS
jgi:hypothetical protein